MLTFRRFLTFEGRLYLVDGNLMDDQNITLFSCYELVLSPATPTSYSSDRFSIVSPPLLLPVSTTFPPNAKSKLLADLLVDIGRERVLSADPNAGRS